MRIVIPIVQSKNNMGIDDILDMLKEIFPFEVMEAYIINTDNPGMAMVAKALADKSGVDLAGMTMLGGNGNGSHLAQVKKGRPKAVQIGEKEAGAAAPVKVRACVECGAEYMNPRYANCCSDRCRKARDKKRKAALRQDQQED